MNDLGSAVAIFGRPYTITKSRLGAVTKVYQEAYLCDLASLKELFQAIGEKLGTLPNVKNPEFSFLFSFSDQTHRDGVATDLQNLTTIPIGKLTDRVVLKWVVAHEFHNEQNELSITIRISNPINPLMILQAALSKTPNDIDNFEFEMGSTCVTVDGSGQNFADEVFLRIHKWIEARNKPHSFMPVHNLYKKYEWIIDQLAVTIFPFLFVVLMAIYSLNQTDTNHQIALIPVIVACFSIAQRFGSKVNAIMARWASRSRSISLFLITNGDQDAVSKMAATAKGSSIKLIIVTAITFVLNVTASVTAWWLTK